jgi:hypothetical protein
MAARTAMTIAHARGLTSNPELDRATETTSTKVLFQAATGHLFKFILCRISYALGYSFVELFESAGFRVDKFLSPTFEELDCGFGHYALRGMTPFQISTKLRRRV